jgi:50S ribosomal subunit-associated GTPase HflX
VRDAHCCIVVYDASGGPETQSSFEIIDNLIQRYENACLLMSPFVVVVGNKSDLITSPEAQLHELEKLEAAEYGIRVKSFLVSAKTGEQVQELFQFIGTQLLKVTDIEEGPGLRGVKLSLDTPTRTRDHKCC